jgi:hypothetical protein
MRFALGILKVSQTNDPPSTRWANLPEHFLLGAGRLGTPNKMNWAGPLPTRFIFGDWGSLNTNGGINCHGVGLTLLK